MNPAGLFFLKKRNSLILLELCLIFTYSLAKAELPPSCQKYISKSYSSCIQGTAPGVHKSLDDFEMIQKKNDLEVLSKQSKIHRERLRMSRQELEELNKNSSPRADTWPALVESFNNLKVLLAIDRPFSSAEQQFYNRTIQMFPILADHDVQKAAQKPSLSSDEINKVLTSAINKDLQRLKEREKIYLEFEKRLSSIQKNNPAFNLLTIRTDQMIKDYPLVLEDFKLAPQYSSDEASWCRIQSRREQLAYSQAQLDQFTDAGLTVASLFLGPYGRAGRLFAAQSPKALSKNFMRSTVMGMGIAQEEALSEEEDKAIQKCHSHLSQWLEKESINDSKAYKDCIDQHETSMLLTSLSSLGAVANAVKLDQFKKLKALRSYQPHSGSVPQAVKVIPLEDGSQYNIIDLHVANDPQLIKHANDYWNHVAETYSKKLKLTPEEIKLFRKTNDEVADRTILISRTQKTKNAGDSVGSPRFKAGIGIVYSTSPTELLPYEKATGFRLTRKPGSKIAEIIRLTSEEGEKDGIDLIRRAASLTVNDTNIDTVYIYTSKVHKKLYTKWGLHFDDSKDIDSRDVLLIYNRESLKKIADTH